MLRRFASSSATMSPAFLTATSRAVCANDFFPFCCPRRCLETRRCSITSDSTVNASSTASSSSSSSSSKTPGAENDEKAQDAVVTQKALDSRRSSLRHSRLKRAAWCSAFLIVAMYSYDWWMDPRGAAADVTKDDIVDSFLETVQEVMEE